MAHGTETDRRRLGLRTLVLLTVLGPVALVGAGVLWVGGRVVEDAVQERLEEDVQLVARAIQLPLSRALAEGEADQLYEALESAFRIRRLYGAAVYDSTGEMVARVGSFGGGGEGAADVGRVAEEGRGGEYGRVGERRVYSYFVPLTSPGGRVEGLLRVTRRRSDIEAAVRDVRFRMAGVFGGVLVLIGALVLLGYQRAVASHFRRLTAAMAGVERGSRDARVQESGPKEVAEIASSFNRMVEGVERAEAEVAKQRRREAALEKRLRRSAKLAAIGRLAGGVAHELGTPLAVVDGMAQRLERKRVGVTEVGAIREAVVRMSAIVRDLLAFGTRESGERQVVSVRAVLVGSSGAVGAEAKARGVRLELGEVPRDLTISGDRLRLESALGHLLRNAVQAAGSGGRVRARVMGEAGGVRFVVEDSGPGVSEEARERLFEPFYTTKAVGEGSGLGLALVHAVAEEHGGSVEVGRSEWGGARFDLVVPREDVDG